MISYSQAGQDLWVLELFGDQIGYFVDVGAYDGIQTSNTYALELAGWDGVCVEAHPGHAEACHANRSCTTVHAAAARRSGFVNLLGDRVVTQGGMQVPAANLTDILIEAGAPAVIDYLSLDIEGGELDVLETFDFARYYVRCMTVEHNLYADGPANKDAIFELLSARGFWRAVEDAPCLDPNPLYHMQPYEDWYINSAFRAA